MRNRNRIDMILKELSEIWYEMPDLRLCQILSNAAKLENWKQKDLFYLEDDKLLSGLKILKEKGVYIGE